MKSVMGEISSNSSRKPSRLNHSKDFFWISRRFGISSNSRELPNCIRPTAEGFPRATSNTCGSATILDHSCHQSRNYKLPQSIQWTASPEIEPGHKNHTKRTMSVATQDQWNPRPPCPPPTPNHHGNGEVRPQGHKAHNAPRRPTAVMPGNLEATAANLPDRIPPHLASKMWQIHLRQVAT